MTRHGRHDPRVARYDPKPGCRYGGEPSQAVVPDLFVTRTKNGWGIELNTATLPRVLVNRRYYQELRHGPQDKGSKAWLADCLASANWLMKALDQRQRTIIRVATEIVKQQEAFFLHGVAHLKPLTLAPVAEAIGMHESTVSRVTSNKYLSCARGLFELKFFFTSGIAAADGGDAVSAEAVKSAIKTLIANEGAKILSDDTLVELLQAKVSTSRGERSPNIASRWASAARSSVAAPAPWRGDIARRLNTAPRVFTSSIHKIARPGRWARRSIRRSRKRPSWTNSRTSSVPRPCTGSGQALLDQARSPSRAAIARHRTDRRSLGTGARDDEAAGGRRGTHPPSRPERSVHPPHEGGTTKSGMSEVVAFAGMALSALDQFIHRRRPTTKAEPAFRGGRVRGSLPPSYRLGHYGSALAFDFAQAERSYVIRTILRSVQPERSRRSRPILGQ